MKYKIKAGVTSCKGNYRSINEDNFLLGNKFLNNKGLDTSLKAKFKIPEVFAICDGMGGSNHGREAALTAVDILFKSVYRLNILKQPLLLPQLDLLIKDMNDKVYSLTARGTTTGCTLAMGYFDEQRIYLANVGDSRIYRFYENKLEQLSVDHNQAQDIISFGILADKNNKNNVLTQYIGMSPYEIIIEPNYRTLEYDNMFLLLCSDGLMLRNEDMKEIISFHHKSPQKITRVLVEEAFKQGSRDNITAMIIKIYS